MAREAGEPAPAAEPAAEAGEDGEAGHGAEPEAPPPRTG
jgi:hypothetical protein